MPRIACPFYHIQDLEAFIDEHEEGGGVVTTTVSPPTLEELPPPTTRSLPSWEELRLLPTELDMSAGYSTCVNSMLYNN